MPWIKESLPRRAWSSFTDFFRSWWKEATTPLGKSGLSLPRALFRRFMLWVPPLVLAVVLVVGVGFYFFTGWRARDLAGKAMENARSGNLPMARLQVSSAESLRGGDPEVRRAKLYVQSRFNDPAALAEWEKLAGKEKLTDEELEERARLATLGGTDEQFAQAVGALEPAGLTAEAAALRSSRQLRRGNLRQSIAEARAAAEQSPDTANKLELLRLLLSRHAPMLNTSGTRNPDDVRGGEEIIALVDGLQSTPQANEAIALALGAFPLPPEKSRAWAEAALRDMSPSNPALFPAVQVMVASGAGSVDEYTSQLSAVFAGVDAGQQADLGRWLNLQQKYDDTLLLITSAKAAQNALAWEVRAETLAAKEQWEELLAMSESASNAPESLRLVYRGAAAQKLGRIGIATKSLADAVRASVREGTLPQTLQAVDALGEGKLADPILIEFCGSPGMTDRMFRVARDRFGRRGQFASMAAAYESAAQAAPDAPAVQDYRRRMALLAGREISSEETAAAVVAAPADSSVRFTHTLALLRENRAEDALGVFHDIDIFVDRLPPGDKAVVVALWEANGMNRHAASMRSSLDPALLEKGEYALILRTGGE